MLATTNASPVTAAASGSSRMMIAPPSITAGRMARCVTIGA